MRVQLSSTRTVFLDSKSTMFRIVVQLKEHSVARVLQNSLKIFSINNGFLQIHQNTEKYSKKKMFHANVRSLWKKKTIKLRRQMIGEEERVVTR